MNGCIEITVDINASDLPVAGSSHAGAPSRSLWNLEVYIL